MLKSFFTSKIVNHFQKFASRDIIKNFSCKYMVEYLFNFSLFCYQSTQNKTKKKFLINQNKEKKNIYSIQN